MAGYMFFLVFFLPFISGDPIMTYLSAWSSWGECSVTCGHGTESRTRACVVGGGGDPCSEDAVETRECFIPPTPIDGEWGPWGSWSNCDWSPGYCEQTRCRECDDPAPQYGGEDCFGLDCQTRPGSYPLGLPDLPGPPPAPPGQPDGGGFPGFPAFPYILVPISLLPSFFPGWDQPAPEHVDGNWGPWSHWGHCSVTEGDGYRTRQRYCNDPSPFGDGEDCCEDEGGSVDFDECHVVPPPVDGGYGNWSEWSACDSTCQGATKTRTRNCDNPEPQCVGPSTETEDCNPDAPAPVNGYWEFTAWHCVQVSGCHEGMENRSPTECVPPQYCGNDCPEMPVDQTRASAACTVYPQWADWTDFGTCDTGGDACGNGTQTRTRVCNNNNCNTLNCDSTGEDGGDTDEQPCTVYPEWGPWGDFSTTCDTGAKVCGTGTQTRTRVCNKADCSDLECDDTSADGGDTNTQPCTVYPQWGPWGQFDESCTAVNVCGAGTRTRTRVCNKDDCSTLACDGGAGGANDVQYCTVDPVWGQWGAWSCSLGSQCGIGTESRTRDCLNGTCPSSVCGGPATDTRTCTNLPEGQWGEWSACSRTCKSKGGGPGNNKGFQIRTRTCDNSNCHELSCPALDDAKECTVSEQCPAGGRGRCEYDGNQGQPHFFNFGRDLTRTGIPCEYYMLSVHVKPNKTITQYNDIDVNMYVGNWNISILGNWFIYSVRIILTYRLNQMMVCQETFNTKGDILNALFNEHTEGANLGWTRTSNCSSPSSAEYGYAFNNAHGNGDNTAYFYVRGQGDGIGNEAVRIAFVPFNVSSPAIRNNEKPGVYISVRESSVISDDPGDKFTNTHCSLVNETNTMVDYMKDGIKVFQAGNSDRDLAGMWGLFKQHLPQDLPGVDSRCGDTIAKYYNCPNNGGGDNALFHCHHILSGDQTVRCIIDHDQNPMETFINCMKFYCDNDQTACNALKNADSTCNTVASAPLTCTPPH